MTYQVIETTNIDGSTHSHIIIETATDEYKSFPVDESNPEFVAFLETADGKAYLEGAK